MNWRERHRRECLGTRSRVWSAAFALAFALGFAAPAGAQNLVLNGDFDLDVSGCSTAYHGPVITIAWSPLDPGDPTASGSIEVTSTVDSGGVGGPTQCGDVPSGSPLFLSMEILVPTQSFEYPYGYPFVRFYDGFSCSGNELSTVYPIGLVSMGEGWKQISGPLAPPLGTESILIDLGIWKPATASPAIAYFDWVYLPEPELLTSASAVLVALASLARRRPEKRSL